MRTGSIKSSLVKMLINNTYLLELVNEFDHERELTMAQALEYVCKGNTHTGLACGEEMNGLLYK